MENIWKIIKTMDVGVQTEWRSAAIQLILFINDDMLSKPYKGRSQENEILHTD